MPGRSSLRLRRAAVEQQPAEDCGSVAAEGLHSTPGQSAEVTAEDEASTCNAPGAPRSQSTVSARRTKLAVSLECAWNDCAFVSESAQLFNDHILEHIPPIEAAGVSPPRCRWADCDHQPADMSELHRHAMFHVYHRLLCSRGAELARRSQSSGCRLASTDLHMLPLLPEPFRCQWDGCGVEFHSVLVFYWHVEHHVACEYDESNVVELACLWDGCQHTTAGSNAQHHLKAHMRTHTGEKIVACPVCGNMFSANQKLYEHCKRQAPLTEQRYQCTHCLKQYASERLLRDHIRQHINNYRCAECGMTCPNPSSLRQHVRFRHSTEKAFSCHLCEKGFKAEPDLRRHLSVHDPERRHSCPVVTCNYSANSALRLRRHFDLVHAHQNPSLYACHLCDVRYRTSNSLTRHLKQRHQLSLPQGHARFSYKRDQDGHCRLQTLRYESLDVAQQMGMSRSGASPTAAAPTDVLALTCSEGDAPETITTDDGRELRLPDTVRQALGAGSRVLVCVHEGQVQLLAQTHVDEQLGDPNDSDLMLVVDAPAEPGPEELVQ